MWGTSPVVQQGVDDAAAPLGGDGSGGRGAGPGLPVVPLVQTQSPELPQRCGVSVFVFFTCAAQQEPDCVCLCVFRFDEVYYGQFVSLYMKRVFFIDDSGPPLGHMILALGGQ